MSTTTLSSIDIPLVIKHLLNEASKHEAESAKHVSEASKHANEAKSFRRLAEEMEERFPEAVIRQDTKTQLLIPNPPQVSFEELQKELTKKRGRVIHVAKRLNASERWIRDLINTPNSKFFIGQKGWIYPKP